MEIAAAPPEQAPTDKETEFRRGIEAAARWVDARREEFDNEHGMPDPDTGSFEFWCDDQADYSHELHEIADGLRALKFQSRQVKP